MAMAAPLSVFCSLFFSAQGAGSLIYLVRNPKAGGERVAPSHKRHETQFESLTQSHF